MPKSSKPADFRLLDAFWNESVERRVLTNGLTVLLKEDAFAPVASVQVWVKTGSIHEDRLLGSGVSHFVEHMLFKGTERRAGREISTVVQAHGGYINAYTTFDRTVYYIDLPAEHVDVAVDLLADAVLHSTFPAEEVAKERDVILREIDMGRDDPDQRFSEALFDTAFRQHPFRHPIIGHRDVFAALTRDDLVAYYRTRYVPNNLVVVVVGAIKADAVAAQIERTFGAAQRSRLAPVLIPVEPPQLAARATHRFEDVEVTRAGLAWPIPAITHPDAPLLDLVATLLGGGDSSVLWQSLREEQQLVHTIDAHSWTPGEAGLFFVSFTCDAAQREKAAAAVSRELEKCVRKGFSSASIQKALQQIIVGEINSRKTMSGQAGRLGAAEVAVGDLEYSRSYFSALRRANPADLKRVLRQYFVPERLTSVSLNPIAAKPEASAAVTAPGQDVAFEEVRLPNGARIVFQEEPRLPNVHLRFLCLGGPLYEDPAKRGTTALLATLLTKDTRTRTAAEVAETIESAGGALYPFSGNNSFGFAAEIVPTEIDRVLSLFSEAIHAPRFAKSTFERERDAQIAELQQDADDIVTFGRRLIRKKFFGAYPLFLDAAGDPETVAAVQVADVRSLWNRCLAPSNVVLSVAGAINRKTLLPKLKNLLARLPRRDAQKTAAKFERPAEIGDLIERRQREQAVVFQAFPSSGLLASDFYVSEVADELFSGMSSRLFERVREEKGLAYFVRSGRVTGLETTMFVFFAGTSPQRYPEVLAEIDAEIERVRSGGVEPDELRRAQVRLKAARRMSLQTNASRAMQAGLNALYGLPVNDWKNYDRYIDEVTLGRLQVFAQNYFRKDLRTQLVVTPEKS
ncbi:insulinase family protein [Opitutaceae bacterium EW11]|nr:insulinase family protein [Opitutaceae bacterium EW11]